MVKAPKTVWLINHAAMPPQYEVRIQTLKRAVYLRKQGYKVYVIGGSFLHNTNINLITDNSPFIHAEYDGGITLFIYVREAILLMGWQEC